MPSPRKLWLLAGLAALPLVAAEGKIAIRGAPAAVQATVKQEMATATLVGLSKEVENGKTLFELETRKGGHRRNLMIAEDGAIGSVEEEVALDSVPPAVKAGLLRKAAGGRISKVEAVTEKGTTGYEAAMLVHGKKLEFSVDAQGKPKQ